MRQHAQILVDRRRCGADRGHRVRPVQPRGGPAADGRRVRLAARRGPRRPRADRPAGPGDRRTASSRRSTRSRPRRASAAADHARFRRRCAKRCARPASGRRRARAGSAPSAPTTPADAAPTAPPPRPRVDPSGQYVIFGTRPRQVNSRPIYAHKLLAVLDNALRAEASGTTQRQFRAVAAELIGKEIQYQVREEAGLRRRREIARRAREASSPRCLTAQWQNERDHQGRRLARAGQAAVGGGGLGLRRAARLPVPRVDDAGVLPAARHPAGSRDGAGHPRVLREEQGHASSPRPAR